MKLSPECPDVAEKQDSYYCKILQVTRMGQEEEICSVCPRLYEQLLQCEELQRAFTFAARAHRGQVRKGTDIPYLIHLIRTWGYVSRMTDDSEEQMAALLHDVLEDTSVTSKEVRGIFGSAVAELVEGMSENKRDERLPGETWVIRKQETIWKLKERLTEEKARGLIHIALADKLANLYSMMYEYRNKGEQLWEKFNQKDKKLHAWYYKELGGVFDTYFSGGQEAELVNEYWSYYKEVFGDHEV